MTVRSMICAAISMAVVSCGPTASSTPSTPKLARESKDVEAVQLAKGVFLFVSEDWAEVIVTPEAGREDIERAQSEVVEYDRRCIQNIAICEIEAKKGKVADLLDHFDIIEQIETIRGLDLKSSSCELRAPQPEDPKNQVLVNQAEQVVSMSIPIDPRSELGGSLALVLDKVTPAGDPAMRGGSGVGVRSRSGLASPSSGHKSALLLEGLDCKECEDPPTTAGCGAQKPPPALQQLGSGAQLCPSGCTWDRRAKECACDSQDDS